MEPVELLGSFREFGDGPGAVSLSEMVGVLDVKTSELAANYLTHGIRMSAVPGFRPDVLDGSEVSLSPAHMTDGIFVWLADLPHYVRKYRIALPERFLELLASGATPPESLSEEQSERVNEWFQEHFGP